MEMSIQRPKFIPESLPERLVSAQLTNSEIMAGGLLCVMFANQTMNFMIVFQESFQAFRKIAMAERPEKTFTLRLPENTDEALAVQLIEAPYCAIPVFYTVIIITTSKGFIKGCR